MNKDDNVVYLHLDDIIPNRFQPREIFDERALKELAVSIKEHGVIQPIIVREINNNKYEIIAGERRYKASALAGMTTIPAIIRNLDDKEAAKVALLENLQRKNLNPIEEARTYQKIIELDQMTQEELAKTMGKSQSAVANKLRLLTLPEEIQKALLKEQISERHARSLLNLSNTDEQTEMLKRIIKERMSVRKLEEEIKSKKENKEDKIKDENDLNNLINPEPVKLEENAIRKEEKEDAPSFLMKPPTTKSEDIINYGEVKNDDEYLDDEDGESFESSEISTNPVDIENLKNNAADIGNILEDNSKESSLADLLNLNKNEEKSSSPAEEALRNSEAKEENKEDYFKVPDLMNVALPNTDEKETIGNFYNKEEIKPKKDYDSLIDFTKKEANQAEHLDKLNQTLGLTNKEEKKTNSKSLGATLMGEAYNKKELKDEKYNIKEMVGKIRETLKELELSGAKIDTDEMDFENQYQILIKIEKGQ